MRLEAVNSTAVHVQWRPPLEREQNGVIRGYQVLYMRIDEREEGVGGTRVYDVMGGQYSSLSFAFSTHMVTSSSGKQRIKKRSGKWQRGKSAVRESFSEQSYPYIRAV